MPVSSTVRCASLLTRPRHANTTAMGKFVGIGDKVQDDCLPHRWIDIDKLGQRRAVDGEGKVRFGESRLEMACQPRGQGSQIGGLKRGLRASSLDAGEVEERVDEFQQPQSVSLSDRQLAALNLRYVHGRIAKPLAESQASKSAVCGTRG